MAASNKVVKPLKSALNQKRRQKEKDSYSFLDDVTNKIKNMGNRYKPRGR